MTRPMKERVMYTVQTLENEITVRKTLDKPIQKLANELGETMRTIATIRRNGNTATHEQLIELECTLLATRATLEGLGKVYELYKLGKNWQYEGLQQSIKWAIGELRKIKNEAEILTA